MSGIVDRTRTWLRRIRLLARLGSAERALDDEMRHHIECETAERIRGGESPEAARLAALRDFGGVERFKEESRDVRGVRSLEDLIADIRIGARVLLRNRGLTTAVVFTFALGTAAACAIFSVVYGVLLRPLPYADPDRLVVVWERNIPRNQNRNVVSVANFEAWRAANTAFTRMAALVPRPVALTQGAVPERVAGAEVSPGYFGLLGVAPALGRDFNDADVSSVAPAVILSHAFWKQRLGADPNVIGRALPMADGSGTVVGVMPEGFEAPRFGWLGAQELWFPFVATPQNRSWGRFLLVVARLRTGISLEASRASMTALTNRLASEIPADKGWGATVVALDEQITGGVSTSLRLLLAAVVLLLLIAVANVAMLTTTATRRRMQELAIRRSVGATNQRLFRQLFTQHALLGLLGSAAGVVAASPAIHLLIAIAPTDIPRLESIRLDRPVLLIATMVVAFATIVVGMIASMPGRGESVSLSPAVAATTHTPRHAGGALLVAGEIAVALTLSIAATLMARSFAELRHVDPGFDPEPVVAARVAMTGVRAPGPEANAAFDDVLDRVRAIPGVQAAGFVSTRPIGGTGPATNATDPDRSPNAATNEVVADIRYGSATMFEALKIPIVRGAVFSERDAAAGRIDVVVSASLASALWPGQSAVGKRIRLELFRGITGTIVGVAGDVHLLDPRTPARPAAYLSDKRFPSDTRDLLVRAEQDPQTIIPAIRTAVAAAAPGVLLYQVGVLAGAVETALATERFTTLVLSAFATIALMLGAVGVFGVIAAEVGQRRKEIGIRMALGAATTRVVWMMLRTTLARALAGLVVGVGITVAIARSMTSLLFNIAPTDPASYAIVIAAVLGLAVLGTLIPVLHAIRQSPLAALREG